MDKTISVSTAVFAALWANRRDGEETEDDILRRLLNCSDGGGSVVSDEHTDGIYDRRNEVHFHDGFEAFRQHENRKCIATVCGGTWVRKDTGKRYPTLNRLNKSIAPRNRNVWNGNWKYRSVDGSVQSIGSLRS